MVNPTCFISYSWDSEEHREWVLQLAKSLEAHGVKVRIDRYLEPGASLTQFMEAAVTDSDYVVLVCTPNFARKANMRTGGVGYEAQVVTGEIFRGNNPRKFVPILRNGSSDQALPTYMISKLAIDFRLREAYEDSLEMLLRHIWREPEHGPEVVGGKPNFPIVDDVRKPRSKGGRPNEKNTTPRGGTYITQVSDDTFEEVISQTPEDRFSLVNFWATWCGPCRMVKPVLEEVARENADRLDIFGLDVDESPRVVRDYQVMAIPAMIAFRHGNLRLQVVGAKPKAALLKDLQPLMAEVEEYKAVTQDSLALTFYEGQIRVAVVRPDGTYSYVDSAEQRHGLLYLRTESAKFQVAMIKRFEELLNDPYVTKASLVRFLKQYPEFILNDEYSAAHSQVFLRYQPSDLAPSFVLQPMAGELCDLLEVEPPQHEIASLVNGVAMLGEVVLEAVARLRAYREYFEEERNRVRIQDEHGLLLFRPKMFVIIGRSRLLDPLSRRRLESTMSDITLRTWDDVLATVRGRLDNLRISPRRQNES